MSGAAPPSTGRVLLDLLARPGRHAYGEHHWARADLRVPPGDGPHPVAVLVHGGYWQARYGKNLMKALAADLGRRGWASWNIEYRRLGQGGGWPATFDDVAAAVDHLARLRDPRLDLGRVFSSGTRRAGSSPCGPRDEPPVPYPSRESSPRPPCAISASPAHRRTS